jgi:hypothetical protein
MCIKLEINQGYTVMHGQTIIKTQNIVNISKQRLLFYSVCVLQQTANISLYDVPSNCVMEASVFTVR